MRLSLLCYVWGKKINLLLLTILANHLLSALLPCPIEPRAEMQVTGTPLYVNKLQSKRQTHEEEISANTAWKKSPHHKSLILPLGLLTALYHLPKQDLSDFTFTQNLTVTYLVKSNICNYNAQEVPRIFLTLTAAAPAAAYCWLEK